MFLGQGDEQHPGYWLSSLSINRRFGVRPMFKVGGLSVVLARPAQASLDSAPSRFAA
jgi:hypothetical protein